MSNDEIFLNSMLNDTHPENIDIISRMDEYLEACCMGTGCDGLPTPVTRIDNLLYMLADKIAASSIKYGTTQTADASKMIIPQGAENFVLQVMGEEHQQDFICTVIKFPNVCAIVFDFGNSYCANTPEQVNLVYDKTTGTVSFATEDMKFKENTNYTYAIW